MGLYTAALAPMLRLLDPEASHALPLSTLGPLQGAPGFLATTRRLYACRDPRLAFAWRGLAFPNPVGLAAGADKNARVVPFFHAAGAGFVEVGTVTPLPQGGNPKPRVFRLPRERAMVNRLGFPNDGLDRVAARLERLRQRSTPLGVNIGKNAATPLDRAGEDYLACLERLYPLADYFTVNVSSPNTLGLTSLQAKPALASLVGALVERRKVLAANALPTPLLVKISPDLTDDELNDVADACVTAGIDGLIATNTSTDLSLRPESAREWQGGLSGKPLFAKSLRTVAYLRRRVPKDFFLVGVGGISSADDAWAMLAAGANTVQVYTALVYEGPGLFGAINRGLVRRMEREGVKSVSEIVASESASHAA
ncbi:MAG: quinone-dependent dihydroorotate dehydrogenase [Chloroflexi bacterium]|nr:quinone-dependent dihydroorotate dehydrogenase [Chloroflexota bacterium]